MPGLRAVEAEKMLTSYRARMLASAPSIGVASAALLETPRDGITWQQLFGRAERALGLAMGLRASALDAD